MTFKLIDLFSGCGGMTLGFVSDKFCGKFRSILAIDNDPSAVATYKKNIDGNCFADDIENWASGQLPIPSADIVIGGPPCQGFSLLNKKKQNDARRELWQPFMDIVELSGAKAFVIENVRWLLNTPEHDEILARARGLGFATRSALLNAADYGTAQVRLRAFIVGWRARDGKGVDFPPQQIRRDPAIDSYLPPWKTVRDAIGDLPEPEEYDVRNIAPPLDLHFRRRPTKMSQLRYRAVPPGGNRFDLQKNAYELTPSCWIKKKSGGTDLFGRLWWDRPSVTIRTEFFKPEKGRYLHPVKHRPITHREAARLMGFPDDFAFVGKKIDIARQIGNAVPPAMAGAVAEAMAKHLESVALTNAA